MHPLTTIPNDRFVLKRVTLNDLNLAWKNMKKRNSISVDTTNISQKMINLSIDAPNISEYMLQIVNMSFASYDVPSLLKLSKVIPIAKVKNPTLPSQLRPISLQSVLGKIIEKCAASQLNKFLITNNILHNNQFGFRAKHSTSHAHVALTDHLYTELDTGNVCILVSLDLSKAFDKVNREILLHKMSKWYNIDVLWFKSYLSNRSQFVNLNGSNSSVGYTDIGVPQGGILSCILFALLINDLPLYLSNAIVLLFADDTNFVVSGSPSNINVLLQSVRDTMIVIIKWMDRNQLQLNVEKTQMIVIGKPAVVKSLGMVSVLVENTLISSSVKVKSLGLIIDSTLNWVDHVSAKIKNCNSILWCLYPMQSSLSELNRKIIVNAYILPILSYMSIIWGTANSKVKNQVEAMIRRSSRFVFGLQKFDSVALAVTENMNWLFPKNLYEYEVLKLTYSIITKNCPPFFIII